MLIPPKPELCSNLRVGHLLACRVQSRMFSFNLFRPNPELQSEQMPGVSGEDPDTIVPSVGKDWEGKT